MQTIVDGSDTTTERLWAMTDANYNVVELIELTNGGWTINDLERYTYDAYGTPTVRDLYYNVRATGTAYDWQHLFTGQRIDLETGLYHYRNRQYHPALGTFVTRDPIGYDGGINLFEYVKGRPTVWVDPKGLYSASQTIPGYDGTVLLDQAVLVLATPLVAFKIVQTKQVFLMILWERLRITPK